MLHKVLLAHITPCANPIALSHSAGKWRLLVDFLHVLAILASAFEWFVLKLLRQRKRTKDIVTVSVTSLARADKDLAFSLEGLLWAYSLDLLRIELVVAFQMLDEMIPSAKAGFASMTFATSKFDATYTGKWTMSVAIAVVL
ncbi:hypothetical protein DL766_007148 [Monosporascus sp. MC13-8B]|uniref:Uncharacterized protein n=1 Tax=Monosporascus cannonballus TaxID=155416 RepID=A0ABY0H0M4_9PEZI|nr:hypothetical protein DL762_006940 [Monosporascus cannonballus]RYO92453.1 hypothetical protein DL763_004680 [Monosporascus cannonballus]RYP25119.1 hypothetical protein DL766_007148 [Monosporascus sp. MC13-8B]